MNGSHDGTTIVMGFEDCVFQTVVANGVRHKAEVKLMKEQLWLVGFDKRARWLERSTIKSEHQEQ